MTRQGLTAKAKSIIDGLGPASNLYFPRRGKMAQGWKRYRFDPDAQDHAADVCAGCGRSGFANLGDDRMCFACRAAAPPAVAGGTITAVESDRGLDMIDAAIDRLKHLSPWEKAELAGDGVNGPDFLERALPILFYDRRCVQCTGPLAWNDVGYCQSCMPEDAARVDFASPLPGFD